MQKVDLTCIRRSLVAIALLSLSSVAASASDRASEKQKLNPRSHDSEAITQKAADSFAKAGTDLVVSYAAYGEALKLTASRPRTATSTASSPAMATASAVTSRALPAGPPLPVPRASTAPMTAGEKFGAYAKGTFLSPGAYAQSLFSGLFNELRDKDDKPDFDTGDYFGDALTRAARSYAFKVTAGFFEKAAFPTIFKQDPRYHRSGSRSVGGKIGHAVSRIFVTQGDRSGSQVNASYLLGAATASAIANVWEREDRRDFSHSARRFGTHLGLTALANIVREFVGGQ